MTKEIIGEVYRAFELLGADFDLLGTIGSWYEPTMPDKDILSGLRAWNNATIYERRLAHRNASS